MLVEARRNADRVGKAQPEGAHREARIILGRLRQRRELERAQRQAVGVLGIHHPEQRAGKAFEQLEHADHRLHPVEGVGQERRVVRLAELLVDLAGEQVARGGDDESVIEA